jgi:hypothetical protein
MADDGRTLACIGGWCTLCAVPGACDCVCHKADDDTDNEGGDV